MRDAQDLEAFLIDFGAKAQGIIVVVDSASELSIDFCTKTTYTSLWPWRINRTIYWNQGS